MGLIYDLWFWVCFVVCCEFVLYYCVGGGCAMFCGAVSLFCATMLAVVVPCFVVLWVFFFLLLWTSGGGGGGGCGCGCG